MEAWLQEKLEALPTEPGVYLMKDRGGAILYVGKAVNLRSRVRSYFTRTGDTRAFVGFLEQLLGDIETVLVSTEKEALLLEAQLIKLHKPRFNVQLRDDKAFICLRLDTRQDYPRLEVVRRIQKDGARYFGPFSSASSIRETLRLVNRYFQLRTCTDHVLHHRSRPCLLHQIGRCPAPCVLEVPREDYHGSVREVLLFLEGRGTELLDGLRGRMKSAAAQLKFEEAARLRDQLLAIERSLERQKVATTDFVDRDVFGFAREADRLLVYVLWVRQGRLSGGQAFPFSGQEFPDEELLGSFVNLYYENDTFVPEEVLLPLAVEGQESFAEMLGERRGARVRVLVPQRGEKHALVQLASRNAEQASQEHKRSRDETEGLLLRLKERLHLRNLPRRMECFDISHFQGSAIVASQVAVTDGETDRSRYRRYHLKSVTSNDDFASMYEVLRRRFERGRREGSLPDLIVIDGGKGQLASAQAAMKDAGVEGVDLVGLAKSRDLEVVDRDATSARSPERVFLLGRKDPVVLKQSSPELFLLTRMRDEAHRFAITFQQRVLRRRTLTSELDEVPGVGEARRKALLRHFGSLKRVREAGVEELAAVEGVGRAVAERVHAHLHGDAEDETEDAVREASLEDARADAGERAAEDPAEPAPES
ncbi:MAG: excinuclease ABC subunit UvrC [Myxococcaceae bacterium]|nr:excinuclease ABC subunit UvrC [Myxococcaceae bacterium]MCI0672543.1 excinuclease ABC subunit UvrC [Myxococcaceae bacterium]